MVRSRHPMSCPVKVALLTQYKFTTAAYAYAVSELGRNVRISDRAGYDDLLRLTLDTRRLVSDAQGDYEKHISEHGC
jgi:hypothetical protein